MWRGIWGLLEILQIDRSKKLQFKRMMETLFFDIFTNPPVSLHDVAEQRYTSSVQPDVCVLDEFEDLFEDAFFDNPRLYIEAKAAVTQESIPLPIVLGRFHAWCPALKGCHTWGHTEAEAFLYIKDAVTLYVQDLFDDGETIPGVGKVDELKPIIVKLAEKKAVRVA